MSACKNYLKDQFKELFNIYPKKNHSNMKVYKILKLEF